MTFTERNVLWGLNFNKTNVMAPGPRLKTSQSWPNNLVGDPQMNPSLTPTCFPRGVPQLPNIFTEGCRAWA